MTTPSGGESTRTPEPNFGSWLGSLFPGYFAMVMATGILAVGAAQQDLHLLAEILYAIAAIAFIVLISFNLARIALHRDKLVADLTSHTRGFAFLTLVAATNVMASASTVVHGWKSLAWVLWWVSIVCWAILLYFALIASVLVGPKPGLATGINGTWFLLTVSTESIAVAGALLFPHHRSDALAFACVAAFVLGVVLYLIVMTMVFLRWTFQELEPTEADPPAWIAAGAVAITVLAGSNLIEASTASERLARLEPTVEMLVIAAWATSTFWFPLMVAIGVWRHLVRRVPLRYHPSYWALVFPLGMYGVSTTKMRGAIDAPLGAWLPTATFAIALGAWALTFGGLVHTGLSQLGHIRRAPVQ